MRKLFLFLWVCRVIVGSNGIAETVILVPGTWNSWAPGQFKVDGSPYFSQDILDALRSQGHMVYVVQELEPLADFWENGARAQKEVQTWLDQNPRAKQNRLVWIGHSAGTFYALAAQAIDARSSHSLQGDLHAISTPFCGTEIVDAFLKHRTFAQGLEKFAQEIKNIFDIRGILGVSKKGTTDFFSTLPSDLTIQIHTYAGFQSRTVLPWRLPFAEVLSPLFAFTSLWIHGESDGLVSRASAHANDCLDLISQRSRLQFHAHSEDSINLEHPEQVLDRRIFKWLGTLHSEIIRDEQKRFYGKLSARLTLNPMESQADSK